MRPLYVLLPLAFAAAPAAAVTVTPNDNASALAAAMLQAGGGVSIIAGSETLIGNDNQQGTFSNFNQGPAGSEIKIDDGVVLTTGNALFSTTENTTNERTVTAGTGSNAELSGILVAAGLNSVTRDQNVISFLFTVVNPALTSIFGEFVFATDEFPTQTVTDVMGIFVNNVNYAFFPGGALVSNQSGVTTGFFNSNPVGSTTYGMEWNGITQRYTFEAPVTLGQNSFSLAIADTADTRFDSVVFFSGLRAGASTGGGGIIDPSVIPLPAAGWLLLTGMGGLALMRRRKRSS